jgi:hypothetical protein
MWFPGCQTNNDKMFCHWTLEYIGENYSNGKLDFLTLLTFTLKYLTSLCM